MLAHRDRVGQGPEVRREPREGDQAARESPGRDAIEVIADIRW